MIFDLIQLIAGLIFCYSYIPQIIKIYKNKSASDVSLGMYALCVIGYVLSDIYIIYNMLIPLLITNSIGLLLALITIYLIKKYN